MKVYVDESYNNDWFFIGMTKLKKRVANKLEQQIIEIKNKYNIDEQEVKYTKCKGNNKLRASKEIIDLFFKNAGQFSAIGINMSADRFKLKAYNDGLSRSKGQIHNMMQKELLDKLITYGCRTITNGILILDAGKMEKYLDDLKREHTRDSNKFKKIEEADSKYSPLLQLNDLLLGSILGNNSPPINEDKNEICDYIKEQANTTSDSNFSFKENYWKQFKSRTELNKQHAKLNIWYFEPYKENLI